MLWDYLLSFCCCYPGINGWNMHSRQSTCWTSGKTCFTRHNLLSSSVYSAEENLKLQICDASCANFCLFRGRLCLLHWQCPVFSTLTCEKWCATYLAMIRYRVANGAEQMASDASHHWSASFHIEESRILPSDEAKVCLLLMLPPPMVRCIERLDYPHNVKEKTLNIMLYSHVFT